MRSVHLGPTLPAHREARAAPRGRMEADSPIRTAARKRADSASARVAARRDPCRPKGACCLPVRRDRRVRGCVGCSAVCRSWTPGPTPNPITDEQCSKSCVRAERLPHKVGTRAERARGHQPSATIQSRELRHDPHQPWCEWMAPPSTCGSTTESPSWLHAIGIEASSHASERAGHPQVAGTHPKCRLRRGILGVLTAEHQHGCRAERRSGDP